MNTYVKYCPNVWVARCDSVHKKGDKIIVTTKHGKENLCIVWNYVGFKDGGYCYSITRADGFNYQERAKAKAERYFGQPILVGHHSEGMHRAAIKRSSNAMDKCVEESKKAEHYDSKAEYWERMADKIDLSMPESIEFYTHKLEQAKEYHEGLKSGKYPKQHSYSVTYANNAVKEAEKNLALAKKLWGDE